MWDLIDKIKRYFRFSKEEIKSLLLASVIIGFIFTFRDFTLFNLICAILIIAISIAFHVSAQKISALYVGFGAEFKLWWYGLLISLVICFISNGTVWWLILPGGIIFSMLARHRLGRFRYGLNYWPMGVIGFSGPIASIVLGTIFKNIELYIFHATVPLLHNIFIFNLVFAVCSMLPIPPLDGHYMFYGSRPWFAFLFGTIATYAILTIIFGVYSWIWALIVGGISWLIYYISFERTAW